MPGSLARVKGVQAGGQPSCDGVKRVYLHVVSSLHVVRTTSLDCVDVSSK